MLLKFDSDDGTCLQIGTEGHITSEAFAGGDEPLAVMFGPEIYRRRILLDLSDSDYLDSSGVGWFLRCHRQCRTDGGKLVLHSIPVMVRNLLKLLRLELILNLADDLSSARASALQEGSDR